MDLGIRNDRGIKVGGQNINNLRYTDDTVLIAENKEDLQKLLNIVEEESRKKGLEPNSKKTEVMVISRKQKSPKCDIFINEVKLKQMEKFKYLGTIISNDGKTNREISARTAQAKINFQKMKTILTNKQISIETRKRALQCYIEPFLITLDRLKEAIPRKRPGLLRKGVVLQHDNATPHSANLTQQWLQRYDGKFFLILPTVSVVKRHVPR
ncbi:endonuclease-reverse transcriptase [Plakobranchus ocellatus]|uniref:Endonuclease-reverse transcriptase n=1 Tax=Plakobranchus ocellatus TaxID=259542 RepID=A0AAV3YIP0_9GAST|nr:endonuclease-reverse transcriptase [Plakobranchus ocellatus]